MMNLTSLMIVAPVAVLMLVSALRQLAATKAPKSGWQPNLDEY